MSRQNLAKQVVTISLQKVKPLTKLYMFIQIPYPTDLTDNINETQITYSMPERK